MKQKYYLIVLFLLVFNHSFATYVFQVSSVDPLTGGQSYQINQTANPLSLSINVCAFGNSQPSVATSYTLTWYRNTVNSTVGGVLVSSATQSTPNEYNIVDIKTYLPSTSQAGTFYYYAVLSNPTATSCGFTGTLTSTTQRVDVFAPATHLNFDGVDDFITLPNESNFDFTNQMTVEVWVKSSVAPDEWDALVIKGDNSWRLHLNSTGTVNFTCSGTTSSQVNSTSSVTDGNWHHVVGTLGGNSIKIYIDGVLENVVATSGNINNTVDQVLIGNNPTFGPRHFNGNMEDVRIWNVARTAEQINGSKNCELQGNETGLVANYKFNQGLDAADNTAITSLTDATANANNGTLVNFTKTGTTSNFLAGSPVTTGSIIPSVATVTTPVTYAQGATATALTATVGANGTSLVWYTTATGGTGTTAPTPSTATVGSTSYWVSSTNANGCESARTEIVVTVNASIPATHLNFDGVNDYVNLSNLISGGSSYTKQAMIRPTYISSGAGQNIISNSNEVFWIWSGNIRAGNNGNFQHVLADASSLLNTWNMVTVTYDAPTTTMKLYINEILVSENNSVSATVGGNMQIGAYGSGAVFNGDIEEVRIWNRALPLAEIQNNMNCELPSPSTQNSLVAYYKFNQGTDAANNTTITTLTDASGNANNGTLVNFTKTGTTSNFLAGSPIVTGTNCAVLSNESFEVANNIKIYPNPSNGIFAIETQEDSTVEVFDMIGKKVYSNKVSVGSSNIDLSNYTNGIYLLTVTNQKGNLNTFKLIKQ
ncbi:LamG-like jellyroll fold domain-containing protein [Flavobacterium facile]|uniref:LamG-like jellyroll fold domain-containing protein n=1 Tax=Flavobacterium facile TaxID=2893174 RepID=UPI002E788FA1|nr:LamG-like jellyroll fold domain-containing protein [Flavobacterium sp. T-12]